ncbi:uncharacterized protein PAC_10452 [Phialocephala subalpina]|uniref:BTB domain-containing protein n=1 Tax=Phialocephala subalpina TaxID=576137 RepID=A0A1L7X6A8_9HELO|nr:uncharacterized protein PAC_10452 [Phialocephala subalpina]
MPGKPQHDDENPLAADGKEVDTSLASLTLDNSVDKETHMLVSSKHLTLASPVFKAMLGPAFREGQLLKSEGKLELDLEDDDPKAFEILMNAIHGHISKMPETVGFKTFSELTILVDKYQILEAIRHYASRWMKALLPQASTKITTSPISVALTCLDMCWVLKLKADFKKISRILQQGLACQRTTDGLPIPSFVLEQIQDARQQSMNTMIAFIQKMIVDLSSATNTCQTAFHNDRERKNLACDSLILGSLIKGLSAHDMWPLPMSPYDGVSLLRLLNKVRNLTIIATCDDTLFGKFSGSSPDSSHGWAKKLKDEADRVEKAAGGLDLDRLAK